MNYYYAELLSHNEHMVHGHISNPEYLVRV